MKVGLVGWRFVTLIVVFATFLESRAASVVEPVGSPAFTLSGNGIDVPVYRELLLRLGESEEPRRVHLTGAGVRVKKVFLFQEKAYVAASYLGTEGGFGGAEPLGVIRDTEIEVVRITTLRDLSAEQIRTSFEDALDVNGVDLEKPELRRVLDRMNQSLAAGENETVVSLKLPDGSERVYIEYPRAVIDERGEDLGLDIWRCWFGVPLDEGLAALKEKLLGKRS